MSELKKDPFLAELDNLPEEHPALQLLEGATKLSTENVGGIGPLVQRWYEKKSSVALLKQQLESAEKELDEIETNYLPNAMMSAGLTEMKLKSGEKLQIVSEVFASIPKDQEEDAFAWFIEHGMSDLLRNDIKIGFTKGDDEGADKVVELLSENDIVHERKRNIHWKTLQSFVREELEAGRPLPDHIRWFQKDRAKVKA